MGPPDRERSGLALAIIGCGSVVQRGHLPGLLALDWAPTVVVDPELGRFEGMTVPPGARTFTSLEEALEAGFDSAIVAAPNALHGPLSLRLLEAGVHVLVEKPMATRRETCREMALRATDGDLKLAVGLTRRFRLAHRRTKALLETDALGELRKFDIREGHSLRWPLASGSNWDPELSAGGVLMGGVGPHVLDQILWWFGEVGELEYLDDARGGLEAECLLRLELTSGLEGVVELSRSRRLRNTAIIEGTEGRLEVDQVGDRVTADPPDLLNRLPRGERSPVRQTFADLFTAQLADWRSAILDGHQPEVGAEAGSASVALIERCYAARRRWNLPWAPDNPRVRGTLAEKRVFVVGRRDGLTEAVVEHLVDAGASAVDVAVPEWPDGVRVARLPVEVHRIQAGDQVRLARLASGAHLIVVCSWMEDEPPDLAVFSQTGARRLVAMRSAGPEWPSPPAPSDPSAVVLVSPMVYGPFIERWVDGPARRMLRALPPFGAIERNGVHRPLYVDDLARAVIHASAADFTGTYLVEGPDPVDGRRLAGLLEELLRSRVSLRRQPPPRGLSWRRLVAVARALRDRGGESRRGPREPWSSQEGRMSSGASSEDPPPRLPGFEPAVPFCRGLELTGAYLDWAYGERRGRGELG